MSDYEVRLQTALIKQAGLKDEIAFLRLQIKQEKKQAKWAASSLTIRELKELFPEAKIDNGAGVTYISVDLSRTDLRQAPGSWEQRDREVVFPNNIGSPVRCTYRMQGVPANLYITRAVF